VHEFGAPQRLLEDDNTPLATESAALQQELTLEKELPRRVPASMRIHVAELEETALGARSASDRRRRATGVRALNDYARGKCNTRISFAEIDLNSLTARGPGH
jgi:hypothetical protein